jgi:peroxiredoxin
MGAIPTPVHFPLAQPTAATLPTKVAAAEAEREKAMSGIYAAAIVLNGIAVGVGGWFGWQLLRQNGRMLLRLEELEKRLDELEFAQTDDAVPESEKDQSLVTSAATNGESDRANRFSNRSLVRSRIKRDGLKAGTVAPDFRLPCLDGTERALQDFRGRRVLLVFSDPDCGPCQALASHLERFHREHLDIPVVTISRGDPKENRTKVKEHGLTFPVLLQQRWEISRLYAIFATPVAYLLDEQGVIVKDVVMGVEPIQALLTELTRRAASTIAPSASNLRWEGSAQRRSRPLRA